MSILIVTSLGDIVVDLFTDKCPLTSKNFLKLCKIKYYNGCLFHTVQKDFTAQTGDPTGTGSVEILFLYGDQARFFGDEIHLDLKHSKTGTVAMASAGENLNASQFYFTLRDDLDYLDGKHTNKTHILEDPFDDPSQLSELIPDASPEGKPKDEKSTISIWDTSYTEIEQSQIAEEFANFLASISGVDDEVRLEDDWVPMDEQLGAAELEEVLRAKDAHSSAVVLESVNRRYS
ncbi:Peptidyl-prolyl cis-trans isomerase CYP59 [Hibiscus syriacus]|uniref:Peptidyl-prolyl cis-trans isomerase n=1 Tax=Hibiscus syriacus TaxID=106335 RepID=A0A6A3BBC9_HIBSY|nr:Peptidyl-prolyl cis-trans isomerase CYP59 [Hibiscus syriacus]